MTRDDMTTVHYKMQESHKEVKDNVSQCQKKSKVQSYTPVNQQSGLNFFGAGRMNDNFEF